MQYQITLKKWEQIKNEPAVVEAIQKGEALIEQGSDMVEISCNSSMTNCDCWRCVLIGKVWDLVLGEQITLDKDRTVDVYAMRVNLQGDAGNDIQML